MYTYTFLINYSITADNFPNPFIRSPKAPGSVVSGSPSSLLIHHSCHSFSSDQGPSLPLSTVSPPSMRDPSSLLERSANSPSHFFKSKDSPISLKLQTILVSLRNVCSLPLNFLGSIVPGKRIRFGKDVLAPNWMSEQEKLL